MKPCLHSRLHEMRFIKARLHSVVQLALCQRHLGQATEIVDEWMTAVSTLLDPELHGLEGGPECTSESDSSHSYDIPNATSLEDYHASAAPDRSSPSNPMISTASTNIPVAAPDEPQRTRRPQLENPPETRASNAIMQHRRPRTQTRQSFNWSQSRPRRHIMIATSYPKSRRNYRSGNSSHDRTTIETFRFVGRILIGILIFSLLCLLSLSITTMFTVDPNNWDIGRYRPCEIASVLLATLTLARMMQYEVSKQHTNLYQASQLITSCSFDRNSGIMNFAPYFGHCLRQRRPGMSFSSILERELRR